MLIFNIQYPPRYRLTFTTHAFDKHQMYSPRYVINYLSFLEIFPNFNVYFRHTLERTLDDKIGEKQEDNEYNNNGINNGIFSS